MMKKIFRMIAWIKIYFNGLASYLGIINFLLLLLTFKSVYNIELKAIIIIPAALFLACLIGYLDYKYVQKSQNIISNQMNDLKTDLEIIKKKLEEK